MDKGGVTMAEHETREALVVAVRMAAAATRDGEPGMRCPVVRLDTTEAGVALGRDPALLRERLGDAAAMLAPDGEVSPDRLAAATRDHGAGGGGLPFVVPLPEGGLLLAAATGQAVHNLVRLAHGEGPVATPAVAGADTRLAGCIALVTGAAQGFGKGIALALARSGAVVSVVDVNDAVGMDTAAEINAAHGAGCAHYVRMDVTDPASAAAAAAATVRQFGGLDMLVANAGVLKAGGIADMDAASFDLVTRVNYTGYFTCVQAVVPWMRMQHARAPGYFMDIVQINSKSGLEGSKRNFAYAGSKFGALGLTQSFALELIEDHIKVNSVCPGNFFDGPLWSDPERGLFVQYLNAGKVPGARTVADVRAFYMDKIPMRRGCTPDDVAVAIRYLREQTYETGQALPVTGGQVMLK